MAYNTRYIFRIQNDVNDLYEIYLDYLDYVGSPQELTMIDSGAAIRCNSGDSNKLQYILGTEFLLNIFANRKSGVSIDDFISDNDNQIRVSVYFNKKYLQFQGFIYPGGNSESLIGDRFQLNIRALDGLGLLKGVDLVDTNNLRFVGSYSVIQWIAQVLYKTGMLLPIRVYFNFYNTVFNETDSAFTQTFLNSITFSQGDAFNQQSTNPTVDINATTADDCYTCLEKIMRNFRCRIFQQDGCWHIVNLYEYLNTSFSFTEFQLGEPENGIIPVTIVARGLNLTYDCQIGNDEVVYPIKEDITRTPQPATKWILLRYNYDQSENKVTNQDFTEGDRDEALDQNISDEVIDPNLDGNTDSNLLVCKGYDAYGWEHLNSNSGSGGGYSAFYFPYPATSPTSNAYIRSVVDTLNFEVDRFLVLENYGGASPSKNSFMRSSKFQIDKGDILQISFDFRTRNSIPNQGRLIAFVYLYANDGTKYAFRAEDRANISNQPANGWVLTDSNFRISSTNPPSTPAVIIGVIDDGKVWRTVNINSLDDPNANQTSYSPCPKAGFVEILLVDAGTTGNESWFKNLSVQIRPLLLGTYTELKGDFNYTTIGKEVNIKQSVTETVEISDSPKPYIKGSLLKPDGLSLATPDWHRVGLGTQEHYRFTQLMERVMYNHLYRVNQQIDSSLQGLTYINNTDITDRRPLGFLNNYYFKELNVPTKRFMLTSYEMDLSTAQFTGVFVECLKDINDNGWADPTKGGTRPENYQFSYEPI